MMQKWHPEVNQRSCHRVLGETDWNSAFPLDSVCTWIQGAVCRVPVHPRQVGVWCRIWVGGVFLRISWMAACVNLSRKGQRRLAFLPPWTRQMVIVSICQADGPLRFACHPANKHRNGQLILNHSGIQSRKRKVMILYCFGQAPASTWHGVYIQS